MPGVSAPRALVLVLSLVVASACHRSETPSTFDAGFGGDAGFDAGRMGRRGPPDGAPGLPDVFVDPGCDGGRPDAGGFVRECDPFVQDCGPGMGCYTYAVAPSGPCGEETFVTVCAPAGGGRQGTACLGHTDCGPGFGCVVTGAGTQCTAFCDLSGGEPGCPRGFICRATDVPGHGACF